MSGTRFSLAGLFAAVTIFAVGFAALRSPSEFASSGILTFTVCTLLYATLAAFLRRGRHRDFWTGFALFGGVYLFLVRSEPYVQHLDSYWTYLPTTHLMNRFIRYSWSTSNDSGAYAVFQQGQILHFLFTLVIAFVGGVLASWMGVRVVNGEGESAQRPAS